MAFLDATERQTRIPAIATVAILHALLGYILITAFAPRVIQAVTGQLKTFNVSEAPAPPAEVPPAPDEAVADTPVAVKSLIPRPMSDNLATARSGASGLAMRARWKSGAFYNDTDYPTDAMRKEQQGSVRVSYTIGTDGRVSNCLVVGSSGSASLDSTTCRILQKRFKFEPAKDASGTPLAETRTQSVTWELS
jgi:protein TonB